MSHKICLQNPDVPIIVLVFSSPIVDKISIIFSSLRPVLKVVPTDSRRKGFKQER